MAWLGRLADGRAAIAAATSLIFLLPAMNFMANSQTAARSRAARAFVHRYLDHLERVLPAGPSIVAEGGLLDRSIEGWSAGQGTLQRIPQDPSAIRTLWEGGTSVVGFARARANLEKLGVRFRSVDRAGVPMTLRELLSTVPDGWIIAAAFGDERSEPAMIRATAFGSVGGIVGDGDRRLRYAVVRVKAREDHIVERADPGGVDVDIAAGSLLGDSIRAPVDLHVSSSDGGAVVEVGGSRVAETKTGVAIAVISPAGTLAGAFSARSDEPLLVKPPALSPAVVAGVEPCVPVASHRWVDVSGATSGSSIGAIIGVNETLELYLASRDPLEPHLDALPHRHIPDVIIDQESTPAPGRPDGLQAALDRDRAERGIAEWPYVSRVEATSGRAGQRQLALRLGGFVESAYARLISDDPEREVSVCSAVRGVDRFPGADEAPETELDLHDDDLFVFGWDDVERTGARQFRWTLTPSAGLLVPIVQPAELAVEITATSAAGSGALELQVNDHELPAVDLRPGDHVHRWTASADVWKRGVNRVRLRVSDLVTGVDLGTPGDHRLLGLAVSRIRLVRAVGPPETQ
jgi:hypothetical protein